MVIMKIIMKMKGMNLTEDLVFDSNNKNRSLQNIIEQNVPELQINFDL